MQDFEYIFNVFFLTQERNPPPLNVLLEFGRIAKSILERTGGGGDP